MPKPHSQIFSFNWTRIRMAFKLEFWGWDLGIGIFKSFPDDFYYSAKIKNY